MNISISFREAYGKNSSGNWLEFNFFQECERLLKCMKRSSVDFPAFFTLNLQKWSKSDTQFWKVQSTKGEKSYKNHQVLVTANWTNDDHFAYFGFSPKSTNFFVLHGFSEISQTVSPTFFTFLFCKVYGVFSMVNYTIFLALSGSCSLEALKRKSQTLLSKHLWSILIVSDHFFEKW